MKELLNLKDVFGGSYCEHCGEEFAEFEKIL